MFGDEKNLKDSVPQNSLSLKDIGVPISYNKSNKLISALFMVTDIMDKDEPLRHKLRVLGLRVITDISTDLSRAERTIYEILSCLNIAFTVGMLSEMNHNIIKKEFLELDQSIKIYKNPSKKSLSLEDFLREEEVQNNPPSFSVFEAEPIGRTHNKQAGARIGVQKGSTLLKALSDRTGGFNGSKKQANVLDFNIIKKQRRDDIIGILRRSPEGLTISSITDLIKDMKIPSLLSSGEKTLQRELVSMVKEGILHKRGEKRWSRYLLPR